VNRLTRDQIINQGLDRTDSPRLNEICRGGVKGPTAVVTDPSFATDWFKAGLDLAHNLYPWQGRIAKKSITFTPGKVEYSIITDFGITDYILDYRDGILLDNYDSSGAKNGFISRMYRRGLNWMLGLQTGTSGQRRPIAYTVRQGNMVIRPEPNQGPLPGGLYTADFYYYSLPVIATGTTIPDFPSDEVLIQYIFNMGQEFLRETTIGTAEAYLNKALGTLMKSGLNQEPEEDQLALDRFYFPGSNMMESRNDWMGWPFGPP
jgi:hypothetical protein